MNVKNKVVPVHAMGACGGLDMQFHEFLTSALDVGDWSAWLLGIFAPGEEPQYPWNVKLGGPQSRSLCLDKRNAFNDLVANEVHTNFFFSFYFYEQCIIYTFLF
jgi:hypothetical protein